MIDSYACSFRSINLEKYFIILIKDSSDSNHSSIFTVLVAAFAKKRRKNIKTARKTNTKPFTEYCRVLMRIIPIL